MPAREVFGERDDEGQLHELDRLERERPEVKPTLRALRGVAEHYQDNERHEHRGIDAGRHAAAPEDAPVDQARHEECGHPDAYQYRLLQKERVVAGERTHGDEPENGKCESGPEGRPVYCALEYLFSHGGGLEGGQYRHLGAHDARNAPRPGKDDRPGGLARERINSGLRGGACDTRAVKQHHRHHNANGILRRVINYVCRKP